MSKARVTMTLTPCIEVDIRGEYEGGLRLRRDNGEVRNFLQFVIDHHLHGTRGGGGGGGSYVTFKYPENLEKIKEWAASGGVEIVDRHPMNDLEAEEHGWECHSMGIKRYEGDQEVPAEELTAWLKGWDKAQKGEDEDED